MLTQCICERRVDEFVLYFFNSVLDTALLLLKIDVVNDIPYAVFKMDKLVDSVNVNSLAIKSMSNDLTKVYGVIAARYFDERKDFERVFEGPFKCPIKEW